MAHNITSTDGVLSVRRPMWHNLGTVLDDYPTLEEARTIAHNWEPVTEPLFRRVLNPDMTEYYELVEEAQGVVRSDNNAHLGVVSDGWAPVLNKTMYDIADALQDVGDDLKIETAGSLKGGRKVWLLIRLNEPLTVKGDPNGEVIPYFALQNAHDGSGAFRGQATMTRIVCHEKGTPILHEGRWIPVEDHPSVVGSKKEPGLAVHLAGLPFPEVVTLDHRYRVGGDWKEAQHLRKGEAEIEYPLDLTDVKDSRSEDFWWAVGLWWADGNLHGDRQVTWSVSDPDIEDRLLGLLREHGFGGNGSDRRGCRQITFAWPEFRSVVEPMYHGEGRGKGKREKLPTYLMEHLPPNLQQALIAGYFDGDGSWDKQRGGMIFSSASLGGLLALRRMLARQGRVSLIRRGRKGSQVETIEGRIVNTRDQYSLRVPENPKDVRIENGVIYSKVTLVEWAGEREFVPITTEDHTYITHFGHSHNCDNTAQMADLDSTRRGTEFTFRHTSTIDERIAQAKGSLAQWRESVNDFMMLSQHLMSFKVNKEIRNDFIDRYHPIPKNKQITERVRNNILAEREKMSALFDSETQKKIGGTAYGLLQAGLEYNQHIRATKGADENARVENRFTRAYLDRSQVAEGSMRILRDMFPIPGNLKELANA